MLGDSKEALMRREEVQDLVEAMQAVKAAGLNGCMAECLESGEARDTDWLVRLVTVCFVSNMVPND